MYINLNKELSSEGVKVVDHIGPMTKGKTIALAGVTVLGLVTLVVGILAQSHVLHLPPPAMHEAALGSMMGGGGAIILSGAIPLVRLIIKEEKERKRFSESGPKSLSGEKVILSLPLLDSNEKLKPSNLHPVKTGHYQSEQKFHGDSLHFCVLKRYKNKNDFVALNEGLQLCKRTINHEWRKDDQKGIESRIVKEVHVFANEEESKAFATQQEKYWNTYFGVEAKDI